LQEKKERYFLLFATILMSIAAQNACIAPLGLLIPALSQGLPACIDMIY
jgi:hypothetical protein